MKFKMLFLLVFALLAAMPAWAQQTFDVAALVDEGDTYIHYHGDVDMSAGGEDSYFTKAVLIGNANQGVAFLQAIADDSTGTEDIDISVEFSQDLVGWEAIVPAAVIAQSTTITYTALHTAAGDTLDGSAWLRLHFDGQTGNPGTIARWDLVLPKNSGAPERGSALVRNRKQ